MAKPRRCPDCSSSKAKRFVVPSPEEPRRYRADLQDAVLATAALTGQYPAWECPDCGQCFGDAQSPQAKLPVRSPAEWTELVRAMLPKPVTTNDAGELLGGDPATVIARVTSNEIVIMQATLDWIDNHRTVQKGEPFAKAPLRTPAARVAELITTAWSKRLAQYRWCLRCHQMHEPEHMHEHICGGCAERVLGVIH